MLRKTKGLLAKRQALFALAIVGVLIGSSIGAAYSFGFYPSYMPRGGAQMSDDEATNVKRDFDEQQATWGFVSRYGRTGRIKEIEPNSRSLVIETPKGELSVIVGDNTEIFKYDPNGAGDLPFADLTEGTLVIVDGDSGTPAGSDAGVIEVLKEGKEGFDITPAQGDGPRAVPVFP